jgi:1-phosphatidylinositol phosphodiesterase
VSDNWEDNEVDFVINYSPAEQKSAFIEDLYQINGDNQPPATKILIKFYAVTTHIENANDGTNKTQLFVSFASGYGAGIGDTLTPKVSLIEQLYICTLKQLAFGCWRRERYGHQ